MDSLQHNPPQALQVLYVPLPETGIVKLSQRVRQDIAGTPSRQMSDESHAFASLPLWLLLPTPTIELHLPSRSSRSNGIEELMGGVRRVGDRASLANEGPRAEERLWGMGSQTSFLAFFSPARIEAVGCEDLHYLAERLGHYGAACALALVGGDNVVAAG